LIDAVLLGIARVLLRLRYRIHVRGLEDVLSRGREGILLLPNHPALIDPIILAVLLRRPLAPRFLADRNQMDRPIIGWVGRRWDVRTMPDVKHHGLSARSEVREALDGCAEHLRKGGNLVLYPSGHLYRWRYEDLRGNSSAERMIRSAPDARIVLVRTRGLWGSCFSWGHGSEPSVATTLGKGSLELLASGIAFAPKRDVHIDFVEPEDFPRDGSREEINGYLESFYNADAPPNTYVPHMLWERGGARRMPEPPQPRGTGDVGHVPKGTREIVDEHLSDKSGVTEISPDDELARDLGLDSLARAELLAWLQEEFGVRPPDTESLRTVGDVYLAAFGEAVSTGPATLDQVAGRWFATVDDWPPGRLQIAEGRSLPEAFLRCAASRPGRAVLADQRSGVRSYRDLVRGVLALRPELARLPGERLGVMLPASVAAAVTQLAVQFAGKTPVMVNWTVGPRNLLTSLESVNARRVVTSRTVVERLRGREVELESIEDRFIFLEDIVESIPRLRKLVVWLKSRLSWGELRRADIRDEAVILFTSGSETRPKAVPLRHAHILANLRDLVSTVTLDRRDTLLGMLPPFHSFGLTVCVAAPLTGGVRAVYHPDPNDAATLAATIDAYRATVLLGTPTFLAGIVRAASGDQLSSVRLCVTGAERCPKRIYDAIETACPDATIIEGYGITECSPVVSANDENDPAPMTIGRPLPSVKTLIVDPDTLEPVGVGERGLLLVRGPSVFDGYAGDVAPDPFVTVAGERWYDTGDLVTRGSDGILTFRGRLKRFAKIGGEMISLPAIEQVLRDRFVPGEQRQEQGEQLAVVATDDERPELVMFTTEEISREQANRAIDDAGLSALHNIRRVERVDGIPQLGTGKTDYRALRRRIEGE
jgi:long-chain-fatty-acid--[acyl-carrier-protein] ligase